MRWANVSVPRMTCVDPPANVSVSAAATLFVKLLNVVLPLICWPAPVRTTVPLLLLKAPPEWLKSPETSKSLVDEVKVPLNRSKSPALTAPEEPLNVPPLTVKPPLKFCVPVLASCWAWRSCWSAGSSAAA